MQLTQVMLLVFAPEQSTQFVMRVAQLMQVLRVVDRNISAVASQKQVVPLWMKVLSRQVRQEEEVQLVQ